MNDALQVRNMFSKLRMHFLHTKRCVMFRTAYRCLHQNESSAINDAIPGVSISHIKQILKQKQITSVEGYACISIECAICDSEKSKRAKIYVNKTTGKSICYIYTYIYIYKIH